MTEADNCIECSEIKYLLNLNSIGECVDNCPSGYFTDDV